MTTPRRAPEQIGDRRPLRAQRVDAVLLGREQRCAPGIEHLELPVMPFW